MEYNRVVGLLDLLIDEVCEDENRPLVSFIELLGEMVETYEAEHVPELAVS